MARLYFELLTALFVAQSTYESSSIFSPDHKYKHITETPSNWKVSNVILISFLFPAKFLGLWLRNYPTASIFKWCYQV